MTWDVLRRVTWFVALIVGCMVGPVLMAQALPGGAAPFSAGGEPTVNEWGGSLIWAFFSSSALEWLKRHPSLTLISERTAFGVQRVMGILLATATAIGVHWTYDSTAGVLTITGLLLPSMWQMGSEAIRQFVLQELTYRVGIKHYRKDS